ncbi:MAG TPA: DUF4097 family beta strand repeat-containing protein, partial [Chthonomonadales bacterium]|nr:DUF4097 family beta strand repeat-containing protein [Chthonomonadales bacterium]
MTDPNVSRILKMLEDGKISAADAETLISALRDERAAQGGTSATTEPPRQGARSDRSSQPREEETGRAKSFEFRWGAHRNLPFDIAGIGKQISDAVRKIDPERVIRDASANVAREARRFQDRMRGWGGSHQEQGTPGNPHGFPVVSRSETSTFEAEADMVISVDNRFGDVVVTGGSGPGITLDAVRESWAPTEAAAEEALRDVRVEALVQPPTTWPPPEAPIGPDVAPPPPPSPSHGARPRLDVRVTAPEEWRDGTVSLRLTVPSSVSCRVNAGFGQVNVSDIAGSVEISALSADASLNRIAGPARVQTVSGAVRVNGVDGALDAATRSGDIEAARLSRGVVAATVSGDLTITDVEGGRVEAKSMSGDV